LDATVGNFSALTNIQGASITLEAGAELVLNGVTQWTKTNSGTISLIVHDEGSLLRLPNLTQASVQNYYQAELLAYSGGTIDLPKFGKLFGGAIDVLADGEASTINLPGFTGRFANTSSGS